MSEKTQIRFIEYVEDEMARFSSDMGVSKESVSRSGYVTRVTYSMGRGAVEFLCGPPEYHAEIFVSVQGSDGATDRLDLGGLMASSFVRD
jgi:hypothetical protein